MLRNFYFNNITYQKDHRRNLLMVRGQISNGSGRNYDAVVFRMVVFVKNNPVSSKSFAINGFRAGQERAFEQTIEEAPYDEVMDQLLSCEIYAESGY